MEKIYDIKRREDRIGRYFKKYLKNFVFAEFSESFIAKNKAGDLMRGVPVPLRREEFSKFAGGEGIDFRVIAENMAWVMGSDVRFKHNNDYIEILKRLYNDKIAEGMLIQGRNAAEREEYDDACIHFRAALCIKETYLDAMYSYAKVCRRMYETSSNEEYVGRFKAESLEMFEMISDVHPKFAMSYYYLGYAYLNMGLYSKAQLAWNAYLEKGRVRKDRKEIKERLKQIQDPVAIEQACLAINNGRYIEGIRTLEEYEKTQFTNWWPLHYYLGRGYEMAGKSDVAKEEFKAVLKINGSHIETMKELLSIYEIEGDEENIKKYTEKIRMVERSLNVDQAASVKETQEESKRLEEEPAKPSKPAAGGSKFRKVLKK